MTPTSEDRVAAIEYACRKLFSGMGFMAGDRYQVSPEVYLAGPDPEDVIDGAHGWVVTEKATGRHVVVAHDAYTAAELFVSLEAGWMELAPGQILCPMEDSVMVQINAEEFWQEHGQWAWPTLDYFRARTRAARQGFLGALARRLGSAKLPG